jgi:hypothetical protein
MRRVLASTLVFALAGCGSVPGGDKAARDEAYRQGAADAVKQLYWAKQALEAPVHTKPEGKTMYYVWEESGVARDGRRLAPEVVGVPVFIPAPAPGEK